MAGARTQLLRDRVGRAADLGCDGGDDRQPQPPPGARPMNLPEADWQTREGMPRLLAALDAGEGMTRYVGGCVRDTLLGLPVSDVDLATRLEAHDVEQRLKPVRGKSEANAL